MEARWDSVEGRINPLAVTALRVKKNTAPGPSVPPPLLNEEEEEEKEEEEGWCERLEKGTYDAACSLP